MLPQVVFSVAATVAPVGKLALGAALYCLVPGDPATGVVQVALVTPVSDVASGFAEPLTTVLGATLVEPESEGVALSLLPLLSEMSVMAPPTATNARTTATIPATRLR